MWKVLNIRLLFSSSNLNISLFLASNILYSFNESFAKFTSINLPYPTSGVEEILMKVTMKHAWLAVAGLVEELRRRVPGHRIFVSTTITALRTAALTRCNAPRFA